MFIRLGVKRMFPKTSKTKKKKKHKRTFFFDQVIFLFISENRTLVKCISKETLNKYCRSIRSSYYALCSDKSGQMKRKNL